MQIKIMTYNIASGRNINGDRNINYSIETINAEKPDILSLNEVQHHTRVSQGNCQAEEIAKIEGYYHTFGKSIDYAGGAYGNALLSKYEITESQVYQIPKVAEELRNESFEERSILRCNININGMPITVLNTHYGLSDEEIKLAVNETVRVLNTIHTPFIFMGDLNATENSPLLKDLYIYMNDTAKFTDKGILTYPSDNPTQKLDYIFVSKEFVVSNSYVPNSTNSDHRAYVTLVHLK